MELLIYAVAGLAIVYFIATEMAVEVFALLGAMADWGRSVLQGKRKGLAEYRSHHTD